MLWELNKLSKAKVMLPRPLTHLEIARQLARRFGGEWTPAIVTAKLDQQEKKGGEEWQRKVIRRKPRGGRNDSRLSISSKSV